MADSDFVSNLSEEDVVHSRVLVVVADSSDQVSHRFLVGHLAFFNQALSLQKEVEGLADVRAVSLVMIRYIFVTSTDDV